MAFEDGRVMFESYDGGVSREYVEEGSSEEKNFIGFLTSLAEQLA